MLSRHLPSTRALQCFLAVAQELNFRSAAQLLNMSQPPLTRQIQALEALLRVQLLQRDTRRVTLTPAGAAFKEEAHRLLAALDAAATGLAGRFPDAGGVRIGLTGVIHYQAIAALDAIVGAATPPVTRQMSKQLVARVRTGALDLAIVGDIMAPADDLALARIASEPMVAMLPAGHPAAGRGAVDLAHLAGLPLFWFARADNPAFYDKCATVFRTHGYAPPLRLEPKDFTLLLAAVAAGEGVALCPQSMQATSHAGVAYRPLAPAVAPLLAIDVQLVWRAGETRTAVLDAVASIRRQMPVTR